MEHKIDDIFKSGLNQEKQFSNQERQWAVVESRLQNRKRRAIWFWLFGVVTLLAVILFSLPFSLQNSKEGELVQTTNSGIIAKSEGKVNNDEIVVETNDDKVKEPKNDIETISNNQQSSKTISLKTQSEISNSRENSTNDVYSYEVKIDSLVDQSNDIESHDDQVEPLIVKNEVQLEPINLPFNIEHEEDKFMDNGVSVLKKEEKQFPQSKSSFFLQANYVIQNAESIASSDHGYQFGGGIKLDRFSIFTSISKFKINRTIIGEIQPYNLPLPDPVFGFYQDPDTTTVDMSTDNFQLGIGYDILKRNNLNLNVFSGLHWIQNKGDVNYTIDGDYYLIRQQKSLLDHGMRLQQISIGGRLEYFVFNSMSLNVNYLRQFQLKENQLNWGYNYQLQLGVSYYLR